MAKVTSKLQLSLPRRVAERVGIKPGDEIDWIVSPDGIRIVPQQGRPTIISLAERLALFDDSTARQRKRQRGRKPSSRKRADRGWTREDLYTRGGPR